MCQEWLDNVFVPHSDSVRTGKNVLLLWDNCPGHKVDASAYSEWLRIKLFPPNVTLVFQPMDQGIIVSVKRAFKRTMLLQVLDLMEDWDAVQHNRRWVHQGRPRSMMATTIMLQVILMISLTAAPWTCPNLNPRSWEDQLTRRWFTQTLVKPSTLSTNESTQNRLGYLRTLCNAV